VLSAKEENSLASIRNPRLVRFLLNVGFAFEPLAPTAISYFMSRSLRDLEKQGLIKDFRAHTKRLGKFHYKVEIETEVTSSQVHYILTHLSPKQSKILRRWFDV
jgi:hypothetical protein